jgi:Cu/Ag efflux protein CusF
MNKRLIMQRMATVALALAFGALGGCSEEQPEATVADAYVVRGEVKGTSLDDDPPMLSIHHEAIPEFKDVMGRQTGMSAMTMRFAVADRALAEGVAAGDKVQITFEMRPDETYPIVITELGSLPAETQLKLDEQATPHAGHDHGDHDHGDHDHDHDHSGHDH